MSDHDNVGFDLRNLTHFRYDAGEPTAGPAFELSVPKLSGRAGELIAVTGRSGSGKSTLIHLLGKLLFPELEDFDVDIRPGLPTELGVESPRAAAAILRNVTLGFVFQEPFLFNNLDVLTNLALPHLMRPGTRAADLRDLSEYWLTRLELPRELWTACPPQLSGGQAQRVAIARAFMTDPDILLADELASHLDNRLRSRVLEMLREHADRGKCVVMSTHELGDATRYADRVLVVHHGRVVFPFAGDPDDSAPSGPGWFGESRSELLPLRDSEPRVRTAAECRSALEAVGRYIWETDHEQPAEETSPPPPQPLGHAARPSLGRQIFSFGLSDLRGQKHLLSLFVLLVVLCGCLGVTAELGFGLWRYVNQQLLDDANPFAHVVEVRPRPGERITAAHRSALESLYPNQLAHPATFESEYRALRVYRLDRPETSELQFNTRALTTGTHFLHPVSEAEFEQARQGVRYLYGGPFVRGDRAGVIITEDYLKRLGYSGPIDETLRLDLTLALSREAAELKPEREVPGFDGRVPVPVVGVIAYPPRVIKQYGRRNLTPFYLPEDFLARLTTTPDRGGWRAEHAFHYRDARTGAPLISVYPVATELEVVVTSSGGQRLRWSGHPDAVDEVLHVARLGRPQTHVESTDAGERLRLVLDFSTDPRQRLSTAQFAAWKKRVTKDLRENLPGLLVAGGPLDVSVTLKRTADVTKFCEKPPTLASDARSYRRCLLHFRDLEQLLSATEARGSDMNELGWKVNNLDALQTLRALRSVARGATPGVVGILFGSLIVLVGLIGYLHVGRSLKNVAMLQVLGLAPRSVARVYQVELLMLVLPACLAGLGAAWLTTRAPWVSARLAVVLPSQEGSPPFYTAQCDPAELITTAGALLLLLVFATWLASGVAVFAVKRQRIVDAVRSS